MLKKLLTKIKEYIKKIHQEINFRLIHLMAFRPIAFGILVFILHFLLRGLFRYLFDFFSS